MGSGGGPDGAEEEGGWRLSGSLEEFLAVAGAYLRVPAGCCTPWC